MNVPQAPERFEDYLAEALARAGLPPILAGLTRVPFTGGRTGAAVERIERSGAESLVSKRIPANTWREVVMEGRAGRRSAALARGRTRGRFRTPSSARSSTSRAARRATGGC